MTRRISKAVEDQVVSDYLAGHKITEIETRCGVSSPTIYNVLRRREVEGRRPLGPEQKAFSPEEMARVEELRRAGWSKEEIARELNTSWPRLNRALQQLGLHEPMRRRDAKDKIITSQDYVYVHIPKDDPLRVMASQAGKRGYVLEHRVVMARSLGRPLLASETVHHINGDRSDNRLENLQLRQGKHGKGVTMVCNACGSHDVRAVKIAAPVAA
jgi:transposase